MAPVGVTVMYDTFTYLVLNAALLLASVQVMGLALANRQFEIRLRQKLATGCLLGLIGIGIMTAHPELLPGVVFDARSVLLSICGLFFGAVPTMVAMLVTAAYRLAMGGAGATAGVAVIVATGLIGIGWRRWTRTPLANIGWRELALFGLAVSVVFLALMLILPAEVVRETLAAIALPVLLLHPPLTVAVGLLLVRQMQRVADTHALRCAKARRAIAACSTTATPSCCCFDPASGAIVEANSAAANYYGWTRAQLQSMRIDQINILPMEEIRLLMGQAGLRHDHGFELRHRRADGSIRDVESFSGPLRFR